ncbi:MAG TPA: MG2 domain-containing protein, partial [Chitinophagaceae bacterium]|nr:MG2 domain-containing protein [Chitinophagaceae bacterium]
MSCNKNAVSLSYTNAKDEVPLLGNLVFRFSQSMVKDSMLNVWDSTEYISFEPAIPGRFRWESPDQLVFSPAQPLNPATDYKARVKNSVLRFSKFDDIKDGDRISFHTPGLTLDNSQITWVGESSTSAVPQLDLLFNYRVNPESLKERMTIEVEGKKAEYAIITASPENRIAVRINGLKNEDKDLDARVTIDKGLKPEAGNNALAEPIKASLIVPSPYVLSILEMEAQHDGTEGTVRVVTSQQLSSENIKPLLQLDPNLGFSVEQNENGFTLRSDKFDVNKTYALTIYKGLRGKIGGVLKEDYSGSVAFGELEANIRFANSKAVYLSKNGGKNIEVQITNVPKVKLVISKIYENNLLLSQRYGYYPKETSSRYASYDGGYDDGYYDDGYTDVMLGDVVYEKELDTRTLPKSGAGRLLNLSQFEDRLPDFKGVYHIVIRSMDSYWVRDSRFVSLSDLGLIVREGQDKIFVFSNSIKTAMPVNGVNVSVYAANNQLIGTGATDGNGVAEINWSSKDFAGFKPAMVIAKTADDFNFLPFNNTRVNTSRFEVGGKRGNSSGLDAFIYAERDIYRPGEKVNFSVIIRDRQWKAPGDIPLKIKFLMPNGKELKSFRKTLNEQGSVEGSIDIGTAAITGSYNLEVYTSNDVLLSAKSFSIEEFVPDRIRVSTKLDKTSLKPGESSVLSLNA